MTTHADITIERDFNATPDEVWALWTIPEQMSKWYGPNVETVFHEFDVKVGGGWFDEMKMKDSSMYDKAVFKEIKESELLVWEHSSADKDGNIIDSPMMKDFPRVLKSTMTLKPINATETKLKLVLEPLDATASQEAAFLMSDGAMRKGWNAGFDIIETLLKETA